MVEVFHLENGKWKRVKITNDKKTKKRQIRELEHRQYEMRRRKEIRMKFYKNFERKILPVNDKRVYYREEYLKSEHWKKLRNDKLILNPVCERCGNKQRTEPHHLRYKNLFDVTIEDLMTLCRKCHYLEHHL